MLRYVIRRVLASIPLLLGLATCTFIIVHLAPGDPTQLYVDADADPRAAARLRASLGLDEPLPVQYVTWLKNAVTGDFGNSLSKHAPVTEIMAGAIPRTLLLASLSLAVNFAVGILIGVLSALNRGKRLDHILNSAGLFLYSMPEFWLGLMLILLFSLAIPVFPASGFQSPLADYYATWDYLLDILHHLILPVFVLGVASAAATARYMRGSMLDVLGQDYIRTARAKGLPETAVVGKHAMRNALLPIITLFGLSIPFLLGGAVVVETVFAWPGMGKVVVDAIFTRDYPLIIGCTLLSGAMVVLGNLVADILYALADPRIRY